MQSPLHWKPPHSGPHSIESLHTVDHTPWNHPHCGPHSIESLHTVDHRPLKASTQWTTLHWKPPHCGTHSIGCLHTVDHTPLEASTLWTTIHWKSSHCGPHTIKTTTLWTTLHWKPQHCGPHSIGSHHNLTIPRQNKCIVQQCYGKLLTVYYRNHTIFGSRNVNKTSQKKLSINIFVFTFAEVYRNYEDLYQIFLHQKNYDWF